MTNITRDAVEHLIHSYWNALDRRDYTTMLGLLTEDVDWTNNSHCKGRDQVAEALNRRPASLVVRHTISNLILSSADGQDTAFYIINAFGHIVQEGDQTPYPATSNVVIADGRITVVDDGEGLKIATLHSSPILVTHQVVPG